VAQHGEIVIVGRMADAQATLILADGDVEHKIS